MKDMSLLGRELEKVIIIDNSPASYLFQPQNAIGCRTFIDEAHDRELYHILKFLEPMAQSSNVLPQLEKYPEFLRSVERGA